MSERPPSPGSQPLGPPQYDPTSGPSSVGDSSGPQRDGSSPTPSQSHESNHPSLARSATQSSYASSFGPQPGQQPYPPPGAPGAYPGYPYHPGYYAPPPPGQYPGYPGYYLPPPGAYPPPPGAYPQPPDATGAYPPPPGSPGRHPSPGAAPGGGDHPPASGAPPDARAYSPHYGAPAPGAYPPPGGYAPGYPPYPAYGQYPAPGMPPAPGFPSAPPAGPPGAGHYPPPSPVNPYSASVLSAPGTTDDLWYLGSPIPDPNAPPAAHGVQKVPGYDPAHHFSIIQKAHHTGTGFEAQLISFLLTMDVYKMDALADFAVAKSGKKLEHYMDNFSSAHFGSVAHALTLGPLGYDVELAHKALTHKTFGGFGTNEMLLVELLLDRPSAEIRLLKMGYKLRYGKDLADVVISHLSGTHERMFVMALNVQRPLDTLPVDHTEVASDIKTLTDAAKHKNEMIFLEVLINRSNPHLQAVITGYGGGSRSRTLSKAIKKAFHGTMRDALLYIVHGVKVERDGKGYWRDAKLLEKSMAGMGTHNTQLIYRLVRAHWDPERLGRIKEAYNTRYNKPLYTRVKGETSGPYKDILLAIVSGSAIVRMPSAV